MIVAGESCPAKQAEKWSKGRNFINAYGPTEATVCASVYHRPENLLSDNLPIGKPISNTSLYVLDTYGHRVPIGVPGELYIGGAGVARGYLNRPELTKQRFIENPFNKDTKDRLYRTGDLVKYLPDGNLVFLGRIDHQVKLRGFRIEPGEIEAVLSNHRLVNNTVVTLHRNNHLVGYVAVGNREGLPEGFIADLLEHAEKELPDHMVPAFIVPMDKLPLTPNGKIDRKALPQPDATEMQQLYVEPVTETEKTIAAIWKDLLGIEKIGLNDNFFHLGGHSLLATRLISRVRQEFGVEVPLRTLFEHPSALAFSSQVSIAELTHLPAIVTQPKDNEGKKICHALPLQIARYQEYKTGKYYPMNIIIHEEFNDINIKAFSSAIETLVSRHESLRILFLEKKGEILQQINTNDKFATALIYKDLSTQKNKKRKIKLLISDMRNYLFNFQKEQSFKCTLIKYTKKKYLFVFVVDHIIFDIQSSTIFKKELSILYNAYRKKDINPLKPLSKGLKDYMRFYQQNHRGDKLLYHQSYYKNLFKNLPPKLKIKLDNKGSRAKSDSNVINESKGGVYRFIISKEILNQIQLVTRELNISFFNFILASHCVFLTKVSGQDDFVLDTPMSIRNTEESLNLIGWLTGALVTRIKVTNRSTFTELLLLCKNHITEALDHIFYPNFITDLDLDWFDISTQLNVLNDISTSQGEIIDFEPYHFNLENPLFNMVMIIKVFNNGLEVKLNYKRDFIDKSKVPLICETFVEVLKLATDSPDIQIKHWKKRKG